MAITRHGRRRINYLNYIYKLAGHQLSELTELSQTRQDWNQLVVVCADPQPPEVVVVESLRALRGKELTFRPVCGQMPPGSVSYGVSCLSAGNHAGGDDGGDVG